MLVPLFGNTSCFHHLESSYAMILLHGNQDYMFV